MLSRLPHKIPCPICGQLIDEDEFEEHLQTHLKTKQKSPFDIKTGDVVKIVYGRYAWYIIVTSTQNMPYLRGRDLYGNEVTLDTRKATLIAKLNPQQAEKLINRILQKRLEEKQKQGEQNDNPSQGESQGDSPQPSP